MNNDALSKKIITPKAMKEYWKDHTILKRSKRVQKTKGKIKWNEETIFGRKANSKNEKFEDIIKHKFMHAHSLD